MILLASQILPIVRDLLDDPDGDFASDKYLLPKLQAAQNRLITTLLENPNIGDIKAVVEISNVPVGTTSLFSFGAMGTGKPLQLLKDVIVLEEKITGMDLREYTHLVRTMKLPDAVPGALNQMYSWTGQDILLLGSTSALDFRVFGTFEPKPIVSGESALVPGTAAVLQYRTAETVARLRGNVQLATGYKNDADQAEDQHFIHLIMAQQSISIRQRSYPQGHGQDLQV